MSPLPLFLPSSRNAMLDASKLDHHLLHETLFLCELKISLFVVVVVVVVEHMYLK